MILAPPAHGSTPGLCREFSLGSPDLFASRFSHPRNYGTGSGDWGGLGGIWAVDFALYKDVAA